MSTKSKAILIALMGTTITMNSRAESTQQHKQLNVEMTTEYRNEELLTAREKESLLLMREEEKLARDVYTFLYSKWNLQIFVNIGESEQRHMDAMLQLLTKYNLPDPVGSNNAGKFSNARLQELYNQLTVQGSTSVAGALKVGATIEDLDIFDLETALTEINSQDIRTVYENLNRGSRNHLRAFYSNLVSRGETYVPQYISQTEFDSIVSSSKESGGQHMKHKN